MQGRSTCSFRAGKVAALHGPLTSDKVVGSPLKFIIFTAQTWADLRIKSRYMYDKSLQYSTCRGWFFLSMVYRLMYGVWCISWCMVHKLVYGVWCTGWGMVYRLVYGI